MITAICGCLVVGLLTYGIVETIHHSSLFVPLIAELEVRNKFINELISCPHCLSYYAAAWAALVVILILPSWDITTLPLLLVIWFGGRKLAGLMNDVFHKFERLHTMSLSE
jgi:hypothetical protein